MNREHEFANYPVANYPEEYADMRQPRRLPVESIRRLLRGSKRPPKGASLEMLRLWHRLRLERNDHDI